MMNDSELLQEFVQRRSEIAFAELVRRHVDLVYSAAARQVNGDVHLAREVAQRVFISLSRQAGDLSTRTSLVGWLYTSVHHTAANAVRSERRRRTHEQKAAAMQQIEQEENNRPDWERLRPVLDEAMLELDETDRDAVLRRFFSGESFAAIGEALALSHEAARKRVDRALDRLHRLLARRGIKSSASALGLALSQHAVGAAPAGFSAAVTHAAVSSASGLLTAGGLFLMNKLSVGVTAAIVAGLLTLVVLEHNSLSRSEQELSLKRNELAALKNSLSQEEQSLTAGAAKLRALAAKSAEAARLADEQTPPVTPAERGRLDSTYAALFRRLRLDRETMVALKDLLALRQRTAREVWDTLKMRGLNDRDLPWDEVDALRLVAARDVDAKIGALLGEDGLKYVQSYERTMPKRAPFRELEVMLAAVGEPLSPEQEEQLVARSAAEGDPASATIPDSVATLAASFLTPLQLEKLKLIQAARNALPELLAANQAAALNGTLKLVPNSQTQFDEWAAKSGKSSTVTKPTP